MSAWRGLFWIAVLSVLPGVAGCGSSRQAGTGLFVAAHGVAGRVHGGQQPVAGSTIQMYAVGTSGDGSAAAALLTRTVTTDSYGNFNFSSSDYSCGSSSYVYLTATGGQPLTGVTNSSLSMMTALGLCSSVTDSTFVSINEVTTVAAVFALAPFMSSPTAVGSGVGDAGLLAAAVALAEEYADSGTGVSPGTGVAANVVVPTATINTIADMISSCINSSGGTAGDAAGSICGLIFTNTTPALGTAPVDTITSLMNLAQSPTLNTTTLYGLVPAAAPFQPALTAQPADLSVKLGVMSGVGSLQVSATSLVFNPSAAGFTSAAQTVTLTNTGSASIAFGGATVLGANASDFATSNSCGGSVAGLGSCAVSVTATPSVQGSRSGVLAIVSGSPNSPQMVTLAAAGTSASTGPLVLSSPSPIYYSVGYLPSDLTVTNTGSSPVNVSAVSIVNLTVQQDRTYTGNYTQSNNCAPYVAANSSCTISITPNTFGFNFLLNPGPYDGTLSIANDSTGGTVTVSLIEYADLEGQALASFGAVAVGISTTQTLSFTGYNSALRQTFTPTITGTNAGDFTTPALSCTVYYGTPNCSWTVTFTPGATGARTARFNLGGSYAVLTGTGS